MTTGGIIPDSLRRQARALLRLANDLERQLVRPPSVIRAREHLWTTVTTVARLHGHPIASKTQWADDHGLNGDEFRRWFAYPGRTTRQILPDTVPDKSFRRAIREEIQRLHKLPLPPLPRRARLLAWARFFPISRPGGPLYDAKYAESEYPSTEG